MGTISSAFSIMSGALDADQSALSILANNVANANTPGYTEENPNWRENPPVEINGASYGSGVTETGATSLRDRVLEERLDQQQQLASASSARLTALNSVQALFTPDSGSASATGGRHRQRHHRLLQLLFFAGGQSHQQRAPPAGAFLGVNPGRRCLQRGGQPE